MSRKQKKKDAREQSTRQLMGIDDITDYGIATRMGELVFFAIKPTNISVLPDAGVGARIYALLNVVKGMAEIEMLALNSKESFENNKAFYRQRANEEELPVIRKLLEQDSKHLDRIQVLMASSREFYILVRLQGKKESDVFSYAEGLSAVQRKRFRVSAGKDTGPPSGEGHFQKRGPGPSCGAVQKTGCRNSQRSGRSCRVYRSGGALYGSDGKVPGEKRDLIKRWQMKRWEHLDRCSRLASYLASCPAAHHSAIGAMTNRTSCIVCDRAYHAACCAALSGSYCTSPAYITA